MDTVIKMGFLIIFSVVLGIFLWTRKGEELKVSKRIRLNFLFLLIWVSLSLFIIEINVQDFGKSFICGALLSIPLYFLRKKWLRENIKQATLVHKQNMAMMTWIWIIGIVVMSIIDYVNPHIFAVWQLFGFIIAWLITQILLLVELHRIEKTIGAPIVLKTEIQERVARKIPFVVMGFLLFVLLLGMVPLLATQAPDKLFSFISFLGRRTEKPLQKTLSEGAIASIDGYVIIKTMAAKYAHLNSYQDTGEVKNSLLLMNQPFKTYFKRPHFFRFSWIETHPLRFLKTNRMVWCDGKNAYSYWGDLKRFLKEDNLDLAIAGATGVSSGAAHTIPRLLSESVSGFSLTELKDVQVIKEQQFEGVMCYVVYGMHPSWDISYKLWIGKDDYLVRKIVEGTDTEIHRNIKTDIEIPDEIFNFKPPIKALPSER